MSNHPWHLGSTASLYPHLSLLSYVLVSQAIISYRAIQVVVVSVGNATEQKHGVSRQLVNVQTETALSKLPACLCEHAATMIHGSRMCGTGLM